MSNFREHAQKLAKPDSERGRQEKRRDKEENEANCEKKDKKRSRLMTK